MCRRPAGRDAYETQQAARGRPRLDVRRLADVCVKAALALGLNPRSRRFATFSCREALSPTGGQPDKGLRPARTHVHHCARLLAFSPAARLHASGVGVARTCAVHDRLCTLGKIRGRSLLRQQREHITEIRPCQLMMMTDAPANPTDAAPSAEAGDPATRDANALPVG